VGQTACTTEVGYQEHLPIDHTEKSTVAEHLLNTEHEIQFKKHTHTQTQSEQDEYVHGSDCKRSHRNLTKFQKLHQGCRPHINLYRTKVTYGVTQVRVKCLKKLRPTVDFMAFKCRTLRVKLYMAACY